MQLVWTYVAAAHSMCQTLGLHREANLKNDPPALAEMKRHAFWSHYMADKNLSLCLGRKSNFQDDDIDVDYFKISEDPRQAPWDEIAHASIRFGSVQGEAYDRLYSIAASRAPAEQRLQAGEELAQKMIDLRNELVAVCTRTSWLAFAAVADMSSFRLMQVGPGMESISAAWSTQPTLSRTLS